MLLASELLDGDSTLDELASDAALLDSTTTISVEELDSLAVASLEELASLVNVSELAELLATGSSELATDDKTAVLLLVIAALELLFITATELLLLDELGKLLGAFFEPPPPPPQAVSSSTGISIPNLSAGFIIII